MNEKELLRAVGGISDDLILEASGEVKKVRRVRLTALVLAAALVVLTSLTALAGGVVLRRSGHIYGRPHYTSLPSPETLMRDVGIAPQLPQQFSNGFAFSEASIAQDEDYDEDGVLWESYRSLSCDYKKGVESIALLVDAAAAGNQMDEDKTAAVYRGCELKYAGFLNKFVPPDYQLTEQEQEGCDYAISYGSAEIKLCRIQNLGWEYGGLNYILCAIDSSLDEQALVQMAKEIIDLQGDTK